jgi:serine/threonine protein kinase
MSLVKSCGTCASVYAGDVCPTCAEKATTASAERTVCVELKPGTTIGGFEIVGMLGRGGMGMVYRARQPSLDRTVALKLLMPQRAADTQLQARFEQEAKALARLSDPNIVSVYDAGVAQGTLFVAMEYVEGRDLRRVMKERPIPPDETVKIVRQVCSALDYAHGKGVVHRDIKPENLLIDDRGRVRIVDFGLAHLARGGVEQLRLTQSTSAMGTMHYVAPEQLDRPLEVDGRADVYSTGVVLYELLTGQLPMGRFDPPSKRAGVDARLDAIVMCALEQDPAKRYASAKAFGEALDGLATAAPPKETPPAPPPAPEPAESGAPVALIVAVVLLVGVVIAIAAWPRKEPGPSTGGAPPPATTSAKPPDTDALLESVRLTEEQGPGACYSQAHADLPHNPLWAKAPEEIVELVGYLRFIGVEGLSRADIAAGYVAAFTQGTMVALKSSAAERIEKQFLTLRFAASRWTHRQGEFLVLVLTGEDSREPFVEFVALLQKKLGLPVTAPDLPMERIAFDDTEAPHPWTTVRSVISREREGVQKLGGADAVAFHLCEYAREQDVMRIAIGEFASPERAAAFAEAAGKLDERPTVVRAGVHVGVVRGSGDPKAFEYVLEKLKGRLGAR